MARKQDVYWLSDAEWEVIRPHLPSGRRGARRVDDRRVISGIMHMLRSGGRWKDCPAVYGPYTTIYNRWNRWSQQGVPAGCVGADFLRSDRIDRARNIGFDEASRTSTTITPQALSGAMSRLPSLTALRASAVTTSRSTQSTPTSS